MSGKAVKGEDRGQTTSFYGEKGGSGRSPVWELLQGQQSRAEHATKYHR
jgi:hypothetical protein